jgi:chromatin remodeling complex protein RSC6
MARKTKQSTTKSAPAPEPASEPEPVVQAVNEVVEETTEPTIGDAFGDMLTQLTALRSQITALSAQVRTLRTRSEREIRAAQKAGRKRKNTNRKPSGFVKPTLISTELASFLGKPKGTEMARTEVTREINQYIRENNLKDPENGRRILADSKLRKLLKLGKGDELTYFNLQRYIKHHFAKAGETI